MSNFYTFKKIIHLYTPSLDNQIITQEVIETFSLWRTEFPAESQILECIRHWVYSWSRCGHDHIVISINMTVSGYYAKYAQSKYGGHEYIIP